jgi:REP element-mobilizing transposase RayT
MAYSDLQTGRFSNNNQIYFVTTVIHQRKLLFQDFFCGKIIVHEMKALHERGVVDSLAWVVMPDHIHWLFKLNNILSLSKTMQQFKAHTAHNINKYSNQKGTVWQKAYYDHALRKEDDIKGISRYIVANPLRAGIVKHISDYPLWDAVWI